MKYNRKDFLVFGIAKLIQSMTWFLFFSRGSMPEWMSANLCNSFIFISIFMETIVVLSIIKSEVGVGTTISFVIPNASN